MTDADTRRRWTIRSYVPAGEDRGPEFAATVATAHLREIIRDQGHVIDADSLERGESTAIMLDGLDQRGYREARPGETPDGHIVEWSAAATHRHVDEEPVTGTRDEHGVVVDVPEGHRRNGGGLRVRHDLAGPVTVSAYNVRAHKIGYLFASPIDDDIEHVELLPGAYRLRVVLDPEE